MKLVIDGREYDAQRQPFLGDLRLLKKAFGFGWGTVAKRLEGLDSDADWSTLLDDVDFIEALLAWMWMARLRAGDRDCTVDEVRMTPLDSIAFKAEAGDEADEGDDAPPTSAPTGSDRGDAPAASEAPASTARSTKKLKKPSTSG